MNFIEIITIATISSKPEKLAKEFVVKINDRGSLYTDELIKLINKNEKVNSKLANKVKYGDYIVFETNQVSLSKDSDEVADLDLPIYKLIDDFDKVKRLVKNFFANTFEPKTTCNICDFCPFNQYCKEYTDHSIIRNGEFVNYAEKVTILGNSVKVGYQAYKIKESWNGRRFVNIEGEKFEVKSDYRGLYLKLVE